MNRILHHNDRIIRTSVGIFYYRKTPMIFNSINEPLMKGNLDYLDKAIQFILFPLTLLFGAIIIFGIVFIDANLLFENRLIYFLVWAILVLSCFLAFLFFIPRLFYNMYSTKAMTSLLKGMFLMLGAFLKNNICIQKNYPHCSSYQK